MTDLYREHAVGLIRLAVVMLGDRPTAEDVVQEAFCGLYRRWSHLSDPTKSLFYVRSSVLNGCRTAMRKRARRIDTLLAEPAAASAEADAIVGEEHRAVTTGNQRGIAVYSLASGAGRSWAMAGLRPGELSFLSWSANGTWVQYGQQHGSAAYLGRLNPDAAGGSLPAEVRLPVGLPGGVQSLAVSPGGDLFAAIRPSTVSPGWAVIEYPARTWRPRPLISVPASPGPDGPSILWSSATGSTLIVTPATDQIGVISNGLYSALPSAILGNRVFRNNVSWS